MPVIVNNIYKIKWKHTIEEGGAGWNIIKKDSILFFHGGGGPTRKKKKRGAKQKIIKR